MRFTLVTVSGALPAMVSAVRHVEVALGDASKAVTASEAGNRAVARKSIVARCAIRKGEIFGEQNLAVKRPGTGISPMRWYEILGQVADRDYVEDELIAETALACVDKNVSDEES